MIGRGGEGGVREKYQLELDLLPLASIPWIAITSAVYIHICLQEWRSQLLRTAGSITARVIEPNESYPSSVEPVEKFMNSYSGNHARNEIKFKNLQVWKTRTRNGFLAIAGN